MNAGRLSVLVSLAAFAFACMAEPFPSDQLTGVWRMTKTYSTGNDFGAELAQGRLTVTMSFLGSNRCKATFNSIMGSGEYTYIFDFDYSNGEIVFTKRNGHESKADRDRLFGALRASRFALVMKDNDTFEMRYSDIPALSKNWVGNGDCQVEYLPDGYLIVTKTVMSSGGRTFNMTERHPPMLFNRIVDSDCVTDSDYAVLAFGREDENAFTYLFKLRFNGDENIAAIPEDVKRELKSYVVEDYAESFSDADVRSLRVDFNVVKIDDGIVEGRVSVVKIDVVSFSYSPRTRTGKISVMFDNDQQQIARSYVARNIATLVRDKNIALVTGEVPPEATVRIEGETLKEGGILDVLFKAVD